MSQTLCSIPWNHLAIQQNGDYRACCQCIHPPTFGGLGKNVKTDSFNDARNSAVLKDMRASMMRGEKPEVCKLCWDDENMGFHSRRYYVNGMYGRPDTSTTLEDGTIDTEKSPLKYMDIRFGNLCNQACRSCGPSDSSLWVEEAAKQGTGFSFYSKKEPYKFVPKGKTWTIEGDDFQWYEKPNFLEQFEKHIHTIDRIYFTGGEPTVNKAHFKTLDLIIEKGLAKGITLEYNSNVMAIPDHLIEKWSHFNLVNMGASVDAYGELANYVRWPSTWDVIEKNLLRIDAAENIKLNFSISSTISILNVLSFLDLIKWMQATKFRQLRNVPSFHVLHGPRELCLQILPDDLKKFITSQYEEFFKTISPSLVAHLNPILSFMNEGQYDEAQFKRFFFRMNQMDLNREQKLADYLPWLAEYSF